MISREFLEKSILHEGDCRALALLLAVLLKGPTSVTTSNVLQMLSQLQIKAASFDERIQKQLFVLFEQLVHTHQEPQYIPILRVLYELLIANTSTDQKTLINGVYSFWRHMDSEGQIQCTDILKESFHYNLFMESLPLLVDSCISKLKFSFIFEHLSTNNFQERLVIKLLKEYPQDNSSDWSYCFSKLAQYCGESNTNSLEVLYSFMDALYARKFSIASEEESVTIIQYLATVELPQFSSYCMSRFTMSIAAGLKPGSLLHLPFHHAKFSQCSLRFLLSFLRTRYDEIWKPLIIKLFGLFTPAELLKITFWEVGLKVYQLYANFLSGSWEVALAEESLRNMALLKHLYENEMYPHPKTLLQPLNMTLNYDPEVLQTTLLHLDALIQRISVGEVESDAYVYMSAAFKAFLLRPSQCSHGYVMMLLQSSDLVIEKLAKLIAMLGRENGLEQHYNPIKCKWYYQAENLGQAVRLIHSLLLKLDLRMTCIEWPVKLLDPEHGDFIELEEDQRDWALHCYNVFEKEDKEMNPIVLCALFKPTSDLNWRSLRSYMERWSYLDWSPLLPFILLRMGDWALGMSILKQCDSYARVFQKDSSFLLLKSIVERIDVLGEDLVGDLVVAFNSGEPPAQLNVYRECLDAVAAGGNDYLSMVFVMAAPTVPSARFVHDLWSKLLFQLTGQSTAPLTSYNYTNFRSQVPLYLKKRLSMEELFCQFTKWCCEQPLLSFMEQTWSEALKSPQVMRLANEYRIYWD